MAYSTIAKILKNQTLRGFNFLRKNILNHRFMH